MANDRVGRNSDGHNMGHDRISLDCTP
ncbi:hypothetical protein D4764_07G0007620 [Takifugu flavidus]|uniref:Uncharacterized protein n=1 Tax=Takifugu flavidus TaxID=433684 RepID=A0A5C6MSV4_9TELE|nr:hypothetical protein D4764_07G0007620 [Takifugu flavidus]